MSTRAGTLMAALAAVVLITNAGAVHADEIAAEEVIVGEEVVPPPAAPPPEKEPCCTIWPLGYVDTTFDDITAWWAKPIRGMTIGSGLSTAFQWDFNEPSDDKVPYRFVTNHGSYYVELFQFSLGYNWEDPKPGTFGGNVVFNSGRISRRMKADWNGSGVIPDTWWEGKEAELQEAYGVWNVPIGNGLKLKGGKFVTIIGSEVIEPWLNPTFSRSYMFMFGAPFTHTGGLATYDITDIVSITAGGVIGWDNVFDNNSAPSAIGQIAISPSEEADLYVSGIYGPEQTCAGKPGVLPTLQGQGCDSNMRGVVDTVLNVRPMENLGTTFEFMWGSESEASQINPGRHGQWIGFSGTITYDFLDCFQVATRGEWFQDWQGIRLQAVDARPSSPSYLDTVGATVWEVTFDVKAMLSEHIYLRTEYRYDGSDKLIFNGVNSDGQANAWRGQNTVAVELGYYF